MTSAEVPEMQGEVPSAAEAEIFFGALMAPFSFAQGRLWKLSPFPASARPAAN
jgi:hypothetical protein